MASKIVVSRNVCFGGDHELGGVLDAISSSSLQAQTPPTQCTSYWLRCFASSYRMKLTACQSSQNWQAVRHSLMSFAP